MSTAAPPTARLTLVTGPSRSGKSEWAEAIASQAGHPVLYIATSQLNADDPEWAARIQQHQQRRPESWRTWEVPEHLADAIAEAPRQHIILVDSLGTWLANCLEQEAALWQATQTQLLRVLEGRGNPVILVAEEVGWGLVPPYPSGRLFRDRLGTLVRQLGAVADQVYLVTAGYALDVKRLGTPVS